VLDSVADRPLPSQPGLRCFVEKLMLALLHIDIAQEQILPHGHTSPLFGASSVDLKRYHQKAAADLSATA
jgi:hypothetical protein